MKPHRAHLGLLATAVLAFVLTGCGSDQPSAGSSTTGSAPDATEPDATLIDKSGDTPADVLTIRLVNENSDPGAEGEGLDEFVRLVGQLSNGAMKVQILPKGRLPSEVWDAQRGPDAHTQAVIKGTADLGFIGNNYWGLEGVTTTEAAQAPLLIRSATQGVAVADDPQLVNDIFAGLGDVGVVGLQMFPQNFKVLVSFDGPITSAADLSGKVLQSRAAPELFDFYTAVGAKPQQDSVGRQTYVAPPWIQADWGEGVAVGNMPIYFVYFDLVANKDFWAGLTADQQAIVSEAAAKAQDFVVDHLPEKSSAADLAAYCNRGSSVEHLDDSGISTFETAAAHVVDGLRADPATAAIIDEIDALKVGTTPTVYPECGPDQQASVGQFPTGVYRFEITEDDLSAANIDKDTWSANLGIFTVTVKDGRYTWTQQAPDGPAIDPALGGYAGGGTYEAAADAVTFVETAFAEPVTTKLQWQVDSDGSLTFQIVDAGRDFPRFFFGEPWRRIGDA